MANSDDFIGHLLDMVHPPGSVAARRMFGGHGLFRDGVMIGLVADDTLFLKVDDTNRAAFEAAGCGPFVYEAKGKRTVMSYYQAPPDALEDEGLLADWLASAYAAAVRADAAKPARQRRRK